MYMFLLISFYIYIVTIARDAYRYVHLCAKLPKKSHITKQNALKWLKK